MIWHLPKVTQVVSDKVAFVLMQSVYVIHPLNNCFNFFFLFPHGFPPHSILLIIMLFTQVYCLLLPDQLVKE